MQTSNRSWKSWTDKDDQFLISNCTQLTYREMGAQLERPSSSIQARLIRLRKKGVVPKNPVLEWSEEQEREAVKFIKANHKTMSIQKMMDCLQKGYDYVSNRIPKKAIRKRFCKWTSSDTQYLLDNYKVKSAKEIAEVLGISAIRVMAKRKALNLKSCDYQFDETKPYSAWEKQYILDNWRNKTNQQIADHLGRSRQSVRVMATKKLRLKRSKEDCLRITQSEGYLTNGYVAYTIARDNVLRSELLAYPDLIELKRQQLMLSRTIRQV